MIAELKSINLTDLDLFKNAFARAKRIGWIHYFPLLYLYSLGKNQTLLYREDSGSICTFLHKKNVQGQPDGRLVIYFPPAPMNEAALRNSIDLANDFNKSAFTRIIWVDEHEAEEIAAITGLEYELDYRYDEYLYDPELYRELTGKQFARIRHQNNKISRIPYIEVLPYSTSYAGACLDLLREWESTQGTKYKHYDDHLYTRNCLKYADRFDDADLFGRVVTINGEIKSFAFGGQISEDMGTWFISKSDHSITGLNNYILCELFRSMESVRLINGSSDLGYPGLRFAKESLQPVGRVKTYTIRRLTHLRAPVPEKQPRDTAQPSVVNTPEFLHNELAGLRSLTLADLKRYQAALENTPQRTATACFPWLLAAGASPETSILVGVDSGCLCIFLLEQALGRHRLHLYQPPMPMDHRVLENCLATVNAFNRDLSGRVLCLGESQGLQLAASRALDLVEVEPQEAGCPVGDLDDLHLRTATFEGRNGLSARPLATDDKADCLALLENCHDRRRVNKTGDDTYLRIKYLLRFFDHFPQEMLQGRVYEERGTLRGYALASPITGSGDFALAVVADADREELSTHIRREFLSHLFDTAVVSIPKGHDFQESSPAASVQFPPRPAEKICEGAQQAIIGGEPAMHTGNDMLGGLKALTMEDQPAIDRHLAASANDAWFSFFPYLYSFAQRKHWQLYWEIYRGSVCLYCLQERLSGKRLDLYMPPFPFRATTLGYALARMRRFNGDDEGQILRAGEDERQDLTRLGYECRKIEDEDIYSRESLQTYRSKWAVAGNVVVRAYVKEDEAECLDLLIRWRQDRIDRGKEQTGYFYKRSCIQNALDYPAGTLLGVVLQIDGRIEAVCFAGNRTPGSAEVFFCVASPGYREMKLFLYADMAQRMSADLLIVAGEKDNDSAPYLSEEVTPIRTRGVYKARVATADRLRGFAMETRNVNTGIYIMAARRMGLDVDIISALNSYCIISNSTKKLYIYHNATSETNVACRRMTSNKFFSQNLLRAGGIPVPEAKIFPARLQNKIIRYAQSNAPVVIKPVVGSNSVGVTVDPRTAEEIRAAISLIRNGKIMVEHFIPGEDYRVLIHDGRVVEVLLWVPPYVVGNGLDPLHILAEARDKYNRENDLVQIVVDFPYLRRQGIDLDYVPKYGQRVFLHHLSEPFVGGETVKVDLRTIHPDNLKMFVKAAELSGLALAGLDFRSDDLAVPYHQNRACVNEINSTPHVWPHYHCEQNRDLSAVTTILEEFFRP